MGWRLTLLKDANNINNKRQGMETVEWRWSVCIKKMECMLCVSVRVKGRVIRKLWNKEIYLFVLKLITVKTCLPCWTKKYAEFVRLLQVSGIFLFCYFSFSGWAGVFSIVPSLPIYVATVQSVGRWNQWISFISLSGLCLPFLSFTFCFSIRSHCQNALWCPWLALVVDMLDNSDTKWQALPHNPCLLGGLDWAQ